MVSAMPSSSSYPADIRTIRKRLHQAPPISFDFSTSGDLGRISAVLFLLQFAATDEPVLILNKRSARVRQPGDLCCPGGGISPRMDGLLARGIELPPLPLFRWPYRRWWRRRRPAAFSKLALLTATALREGFEEMRLNPLNVSILGPLRPEHLIMFNRSIYPLVACVNRPQRFSPNWEVAAIVRIPLRSLFCTDQYACCRLALPSSTPGAPDVTYRDMPCFVHRHNGAAEMLWGATYRIVEAFLKTVFGFQPPPLNTLPVIQRRLARRYIKGTVSGRP
jgi:hypothetical protein